MERFQLPDGGFLGVGTRPDDEKLGLLEVGEDGEGRGFFASQMKRFRPSVRKRQSTRFLPLPMRVALSISTYRLETG